MPAPTRDAGRPMHARSSPWRSHIRRRLNCSPPPLAGKGRVEAMAPAGESPPMRWVAITTRSWSNRCNPYWRCCASGATRPKPMSTTAGRLARRAGARAGIGWLGKNTNLLIPGIGSNVLLAEIVTSAPLDTDAPLKKNCGACDACMRVCPTGALVAPGVLDNRRCISFWTIEHRGVIPRDVRPLIGDWIFGCDLCQEVCPVNARPAAPDPTALAAFGPAIEARPRLEALLTLDDAAFQRRFRESALWRTRRAGLLRNVCIALGNVADRGSVPALAGALDDPAALVRGVAGRAAGRVGGRTAGAALTRALSREADAWVRDECGLALQACGPLAVPSAV